MGLFGKQSRGREKIHTIDLGRHQDDLSSRIYLHSEGEVASTRPNLSTLFADTPIRDDQQRGNKTGALSTIAGNSQVSMPRPEDSASYLPIIVSIEDLCGPESDLAYTPISTATPHYGDKLAISSNHNSREGYRRPVVPGSSSPRALTGQLSVGKLQRATSFSRLARRASMKRRPSFLGGHPEGRNFVGDERSATEADVSDRVLIKRSLSARKSHIKPSTEFSSSPTTPHELKIRISSYADNRSALLPAEAVISSESVPPVPSDVSVQIASCISHAPVTKDARPLFTAVSLPRTKLAPSTKIASAETSEVTSIPVAWDVLDADNFGDVSTYGLDVATHHDFTCIQSQDKLHNSPTSPHDLLFGSSSDDANSIRSANQNGSVDLSPPAKSSNDSQPPNIGNWRDVTGGPACQSFVGKNKPQARSSSKRPPPLKSSPIPALLYKENPPPSYSDDSPSTGSFGSNGSFSTGGFKITSAGMVGKPDRVTRQDSDDAADSSNPQSIANMVIVHSMSEFRKGPTLGTGAAGRVYLAFHEPSGKTMAIKVQNVYEETKRNQLLKELETLSTHISRFLVRFYGAFYNKKGAVEMALEFMDAGCLSSTIQKFGAIPENVTHMIATDCLRGLRFLHRHNVLHRDFKTANVLLSRRLLCAKVSDFGLARDLDEGVSRVDTFVGTVAYMSPERLNGSQYTYASDIWALGISVVECLLGRYPFDRPQNYFDYIDATMSKDIVSILISSGRRVTPAALDFVALCTHADPFFRPTAAVLMDHPWIAGSERNISVFRTWMEGMADKNNAQGQSSVSSVQSVRAFIGETERHGHGL
jgi:Protein kinase domain